MAAENNEVMKGAVLTLHKLSADEKIQMECEAREMYEHDIATAKMAGRMEGREEGRLEGREEGRLEGREEGRLEGEARLSTLIQQLMASGRNDDVIRVTTDPEYRATLYRELGL